MAQGAAHATPSTQRAHQGTGAKRRRTTHTQHNAPSEHTDEQEPSGPGHGTRNTTQRAGTPVNSSRVAEDNANTTQHTELAQR